MTAVSGSGSRGLDERHVPREKGQSRGGPASKKRDYPIRLSAPVASCPLYLSQNSDHTLTPSRTQLTGPPSRDRANRGASRPRTARSPSHHEETNYAGILTTNHCKNSGDNTNAISTAHCFQPNHVDVGFQALEPIDSCSSNSGNPGGPSSINLQSSCPRSVTSMRVRAAP